jgi:hypothetical protein
MKIRKLRIYKDKEKQDKDKDKDKDKEENESIQCSSSEPSLGSEPSSISSRIQ